MIESIENAIQLIILGFCFFYTLYHATAYRKREWLQLSLFYGAFFFGNLYWFLYLIFYHDTPRFYSVSEISWKAAFLLLILLLQHVGRNENHSRRYRILRLIPVFVTGMCLFYMQDGGYIDNIVTAIQMGFLLFLSCRGLLFQLYTPDASRSTRFLYVNTLAFVILEYALWTSSCFWMGDSIRNPYFWFDFLLSVCLLLFLPAIRKVVHNELH